ncbi:MAG: RNA-binding protein [Paucimonas sp.]|nr:RNA-binding protein [Paucimonas sp.]
MDSVRIDKWLWAARFFKTRSLATQAVEAGKVRLGEERIKPARNIRPGDKLRIENESGLFDVVVVELSDKRGPAAVAQGLYAETPESAARRVAAAEQKRWFHEPADSIKGRPTKRDRRLLDRQ